MSWILLQSLKTSDIAPVSSKGFLYIQATTECKFTVKHVCDMIGTHIRMHHTDKFSQHSSNHLASLSVRLQTKCLWVLISFQSLNLGLFLEFLIFRWQSKIVQKSLAYHKNLVVILTNKHYLHCICCYLLQIHSCFFYM